MARTRSLPSSALEGRALASPSPTHSPVRSSSPFRAPLTPSEDGNTGLDTGTTRRRPSDESNPPLMDTESIGEDAQLFFSPRPEHGNFDRDAGGTVLSFGQCHSSIILSGGGGGNGSSSSSSSGSLTRSVNRRRPPSPLLHHTRPASPSPRSPGFSSVRFNEPYPTGAPPDSSAASSMPSTPTSLRSRSPSITSLETIPDSPDAEEAAIEAYEVARLKAAADAADGGGTDSGVGAGGVGPAGSVREKRKRWSVCGAERRGDFEMETIWED